MALPTDADADLTTVLATGTYVDLNGALFTNADNGAGTGVIDPFVRFSADGSEQGYNTSDRPLEFDENSSPQFTDDLLLSEIPTVTIDGVQYYEFRLDINQNAGGGNEFLSLDSVEIYISDAQITTGTYDGVGFGGAATMIYDLDASDDLWIALDATLQPGSGVADMIMYIPVDLFGDAEPDDFVTLYSQMGLQDSSPGFNWGSNDGFEEWNVRQFATFEGIKFHDLNNNSVNDAEPLLENWEIRAYLDVNENGLIDQAEYDLGPIATDFTDEFGAYRLDLFIDALDPNATDGSLIDAQYIIVEVLQGDFEQTAPTAPNVLAAGLVTPGEELGEFGFIFDPTTQDLGDPVTGNDFGNVLFFDISGVKYRDQTGDGITGDDVGLGGVTIFIDQNGNMMLDGGELSTVTAADGSWSFIDLTVAVDGATVYEVTPTGFVQTVGGSGYVIDAENPATHTGLNFANFELFDISGTKFRDHTGDGITGDDVGLGGVTIFIDLDDSDDLSAGDLETTTAADGTWSFTNLGANVLGKTVFEVLPNGFVQTVGAAGYDLPDVGGMDQTGLNFANFELYDISGTKFRDQTGDGITGDDVGLGGVTIFIDLDDSGDLSAGDLETTTAADGTWGFMNLGPNTLGKTVFEVLPNGFVQTVGASGYDLPAVGGMDQTGLDFANFEQFDISGTKYRDQTGDGITADDVGLGGVTIFIDLDDSDDLSAGDLETTTAADGTWSFMDLGANALGKTVFEVLPDGFVQTVGAAGYNLPDVGGMDQTGLDFANFELFDISGVKVEDITGDGITADDTPLAGVTIFVDLDASGDLSAGDLETTTAADGTWSFMDLGANALGKTVFEVLPDGFVQTVGAAGYDLPDVGGMDQTGLDFANFEQFDISGTKYIDGNGDGDLNDAEDSAGTPGFTFTVGLYSWLDGSNGGASDGLVEEVELTFIDSTETDETTGAWSFDDLGPLTGGAIYFAREEGEAGWTQTFGNDGYEVDATSGNDSTGNDFGNFQVGAITGEKYYDQDGDGVIDAEDIGLAGWTINLYDDANSNGVLDGGEALVDSTTTGAGGVYTFNNVDPGDYIVEEVVPADWTATAGDTRAVSVASGETVGDDPGENTDFINNSSIDISGTKYEDLNANGVIDTGESGLEGWVIRLFLDGGDGVFDFFDQPGTTDDMPLLAVPTDANGDWSFTLDMIGTYFVDEFLQPHWIQSAPGVSPSEGVYEITVGYDVATTSLTVTEEGGADTDDLDFLNWLPAEITGFKYEDLNADGVLNGEDANNPIAGISIYLVNDNNGDGMLDMDDTLEDMTVTAADGSWSFTDLTPGDYLVIENPGAYLSNDDTEFAVTLQSGDVYGVNDDTTFLNYLPAEISGVKLEDTDGDGVEDAGETTPIAGITINLYNDVNGDGMLDGGDTLADTTATAADGTWSFADLTPGDYLVEEVLSGGYLSNDDTVFSVTLESGDDYSGNADTTFLNYLPGRIEGLKFWDDNRNGVQDGGEAGAGGWTIQLFEDTNENGAYDDGVDQLIDTQVTAADGSYAFEDLDFGTYFLREVLLDGYVQTFPAGDGVHTVVIDESGETFGDDAGEITDFGNDRIDGPGVRTPGFWKSPLGQTFWDGDKNNDGVLQPGQSEKDGDDFPEDDLLYAVDSNGDGVIDGADEAGLLVGDWNFNGLTDAGEETRFYDLQEALDALIAEKGRGPKDGLDLIERGLVAAWLNTLAFNPVGNTSDPDDPAYWIDQGVQFVNEHEPGPVRTNSAPWKNDLVGLQSGKEIHNNLGTFNEEGFVLGENVAFDGDDWGTAAAQSWLATHSDPVLDGSATVQANDDYQSLLEVDDLFAPTWEQKHFAGLEFLLP